MSERSHDEEAELPRTELEAYRGIFDVVSDGIAFVDRGGRLVEVNRSLAEMVGRRPEQLVGATFDRLTMRERNDLGALFESLRRAIDGETQQIELVGRRRSGDPFPVDAVFQPAMHEGARVAVALLRDASGRVSAEQAVRRSERRYRTLFETSSDGLLVAGPDMCALDCNDRACQILGMDRTEILDHPLSEVLESVDPDADVRVERFLSLLNFRSAHLHEFRMLRDDERERWLDLEGHRVEVGARERLFLSLRDVSERRAAEVTLRRYEERQTMLERMRSLGELAAGVAHNFNNALTAILAHAQLLSRRDDLDEDLKEGLGVMERVARDAAMTVRRIQTFARHEDDDAAFVSVDLDDVVEHALALSRPRWEDDARLEDQQYRVRHKRAAQTVRVTGNPAELCEVVVNLIFNALEAMPEGGELDLRVEAVDRYNAELVVVDSGEGFDADLFDRLFDPFVSTKGTGSGLGLSVSHGIVARHGGEISAERLDARTQFSVRLPLDDDELSNPAPRRPERLEARVILVDDEPGVLSAVAKVLGSAGATVETADRAEVALQKLASASEPFDVLVTDLAMPGMGGEALLGIVKKRWPSLPVIVMTGYAGGVGRRALARADEVLAKPVGADQVLHALASVLVNRRRASPAGEVVVSGAGSQNSQVHQD